VPSYWLVDPDEQSLTALQLVGDAYREAAVVRGAQTWTAEQPFPVTICPDDQRCDRDTSRGASSPIRAATCPAAPWSLSAPSSSLITPLLSLYPERSGDEVYAQCVRQPVDVALPRPSAVADQSRVEVRRHEGPEHVDRLVLWQGEGRAVGQGA
jgi:hypothetical protein